MAAPQQSAFVDAAQTMTASIAPTSLTPRRFRWHWAVAILVVVAGAAASFAIESPVYRFGTGAVVDGGDRMIAFLPPDADSELAAGQEVQVLLGSERVSRTVTEVLDGPLSPAEIKDRYALPDAVANVVTQPSQVIVVGLDAETAESYRGALLPVTAIVGHRRVLPEMVDQMFDAEG